MTTQMAGVHDTETCDAGNGQLCSVCRWADAQEKQREGLLTPAARKRVIDVERRALIAEIDLLQGEVNRLDLEYDAIEDQEMHEAR